jgi:hypothetical protein
MFRIVFGIFLVLHGLVHLLYFGHSVRFFELQAGMLWPDGAWAFSRLIGNEFARMLAGAFLVLAAAGFVVGGVGVLFNQAWFKPLVVAVAVFSSLIFLLFWDGVFQNLSNKGLFAILINVGILLLVLVFHLPRIAISN